MRLLSDCPGELASWVGPEHWRSCRAADLPPAEGALWRSLGDAPGLAVAELLPGDPAGLWCLATIVRDAHRSQHDVLHEALGQGLVLPGPTACLALAGRGFHGQRGRAWSVAPGNLFLTVGLAPGAAVDRLVPGLTMLPALAVVEAIRAASGGRVAPGIKWVNDVLVDGRKVGGVLAATHVRDARVLDAVLGIGVNLARTPVVAATPFVPAVGCLREAGIAMALGPFFLLVLEHLGRWYRTLLDEGAVPLLAAYRAASVVVGRRVSVWDEPEMLDGSHRPPPTAAGTVLAIEADLSLRLEGRSEPVRTGRLVLEPAPAHAMAGQAGG